MARPMHVHRNIRLTNLRATKKATRRANAPAKRKAASRRDATIIARIKAAPAGVSFPPAIQSWLSRRTGKPFTKLTPEQIKAAIA